jgi:hypothetical protein
MNNILDWTLKLEKIGFINTFYYKQKFISNNIDYIDIQYVGLNFKDVMLSYGKLKLENVDENNLKLGIEYSGYYYNNNNNSKPKDNNTNSTNKYTNNTRVMGIGENCLSKNLSVNDTPLCWKIPDDWTFEEAATIPCVYATVYYCLDYCCRIEAGILFFYLLLFLLLLLLCFDYIFFIFLNMVFI